MKWTTYLVKDATGTVQAHVRAPEGQDLDLHPAILRNVTHRGWQVTKWSTTETGVEIHGIVDWKARSREMAEVLQMLISGSEPDPEVRLEYAQAALDNYRIAEMEASMGEPLSEQQEDPDAEA